tara:strand:- start:2295 stop:2501 length:207 start_codon:yes stop_codon:yes gene_type:complete
MYLAVKTFISPKVFLIKLPGTTTGLVLLVLPALVLSVSVEAVRVVITARAPALEAVAVLHYATKTTFQ